MHAEPPRTLVVFCPDWPVCAHGEEDGPAAVVGKGRILAANPPARRTGVVLGQRRREAQSRCPEIVLYGSDPDTEARAFEPVVQAVRAFTPTLSHRPGFVAFGTRGPARYFGGEASLAYAVADAVAASRANHSLKTQQGSALLGDWWGIGIANGIFGAMQAAKFGQIVAPGSTSSFLGPLSASMLEMPDLVEVLRRLGITTLGDFAQLHEGDVLARFGWEGAHAHRLSSGREGGSLLLSDPAEEHLVEMVLDPPVEQIEGASFVGKALAEELICHLQMAGLSCSLLEIVLGTSDGEFLQSRWSQDRPFSAALIGERLRFQLEAWIVKRSEVEDQKDQRGITAVRLIALEVAPSLGRSVSLWGAPGRDEEKARRSLVRLQGMLGIDAVLQGFLVGGRGPGDRVRLVPFGDGPLVEAKSVEEPWPGRLPGPNPAVVTEEKTPAAVLDDHGESVRVDARGTLALPPVSLSIPGSKPARIIAWAGPWPVDERWWDRPHHRRRARLQLVTETGRAYLLAVDKGSWFVEGVYD